MSMASRLHTLRLQAPLHRQYLDVCPLRCLYHSYDHPAPSTTPFIAAEQAILNASRRHVPTSGFTHATLSLGARDAGYLDASTNLFPTGAFALVRDHLAVQRLALAAQTDLLFAPNQKQLGIEAKLKALLWARLMGNKPVIHRWQEALALMAQPSHFPISANELAALSDEIWFLAGDVSVDFGWYTRRASLSMIYAATELFMTTDKSSDFVYTYKFMERRFDDVRRTGSVMSSVGQWTGFTAHAVLNVLRSKGARL